MSDTPFNNVSFDMPKSQSSSIKVIGVGGGGSNAVNHMFTQDVKGVDFVICNTDAQALQNSPVPNKIQLGASLTSGLGAGSLPEVGEKAAEESIDEIKNILTSQTKMVFITAGMGGGTGTGAAPIIAKIAKGMGILTVGVVTIPFQFEGKRREKQAQEGVDELRSSVDSLIVINNNKLRDVYGNLGFKAGFAKADEVLSIASKGIAEVITNHYMQNIDLHDAKTVLSNSGTAIMGSSKASGKDRAQKAILDALDSPLLNDNKITGAKNVLLLIVSGEDEVTLDEIGAISDHIQIEAGQDVNIIQGIGEDESLGDAIAVTIVATGFAVDQQRDITNTQVKKVYHTLNTEQTAHYNFDEEENGLKSISSQVSDELNDVFEEKRVVHQLLEEEEEDELEFNNELEIEEDIRDIDEDEFIINDITPDLFSEVEEEPVVNVNVFDLPVSAVFEEKKLDPTSIHEISVIGAEEIKSEEEEIFDVVDSKVVDPEEAVNDVVNQVLEKKTVYVLEDEFDEDIIESKEIIFNKIEKEQDDNSLSGIKSYTVDQFDSQPTIRNSSSLEIEDKKRTKEQKEKPAEDIQLKVNKVATTKDLVVGNNDEISPLNVTISEVQRSAEKRKNTFKKYNHRFKSSSFNEGAIDDIEKEPAYKRLGLELHSKKDLDNISRSSVDVEDSEVKIRRNNSFLHDNVD